MDKTAKMYIYSNYVVYKASEQFKYYKYDPKAIEIKRGLKSWEAISLIKRLQKKDNSSPLNSSGCKQSLYKYTSEKLIAIIYDIGKRFVK